MDTFSQYGLQIHQYLETFTRDRISCFRIHDSILCVTAACCKSKLLIQCSLPENKNVLESWHREKMPFTGHNMGYKIITLHTQTGEMQPERETWQPTQLDTSCVIILSTEMFMWGPATHDRKLNHNPTPAQFRGGNGPEKCTWSLKSSLDDPQKVTKRFITNISLTWKKINELWSGASLRI